MSDPIRLAKRVADLARCSRAEATQYIEGGWVSVAGRVVEEPRRMVTTETVEVDPAARPAAMEPATILLHKPPGVAAVEGREPATALIAPATRWTGDVSGVRMLERHFVNPTPLAPLDDEASGLMVLTQDGRIRRRLTEDADLIEHEFIVEVGGHIEPYGLRRLNHGLRYRGAELPPCKVSWQNEFRLRFAIKAAQPGQLRDMCAQVGLEVVAIRRIRIGRVPLAKMPAGRWRYLPAGDKF